VPAGVPIHLHIWAWKVKVREFSNFHSQQSIGNYNNTNKNDCLLGSNIALCGICAQIFKAPENCARLGYYTVSTGSYFSDSWTLWMGVIGCPKTSIRNYHYSLRNNPEERSSQLLRGRSLKSRIQRAWRQRQLVPLKKKCQSEFPITQASHSKTLLCSW